MDPIKPTVCLLVQAGLVVAAHDKTVGSPPAAAIAQVITATSSATSTLHSVGVFANAVTGAVYRYSDVRFSVAGVSSTT